MRPIIRQSTRLASTSCIRQSSVPRGPTRSFHGSCQRPADSRPPSGSPEHYNAFNSRPEEQHRIGKASEYAVDNEDGAAKNAEARKPGVRRRTATRRTHDVPKPPPIPDWFLMKNVTLFKHSVDPPDSDGERAQTLRCIDNETGHVLFTLPYSSPRSRSALDHDTAAAKKPFSPATQPPSSSEKPTRLHQDFFDPKFPKDEAIVPPPEHTGEWSAYEPQERELHGGSPMTALSWTFFEAATAVRASFSLTAEARSSSRFATNRIDMHLLCPDPMTHDNLDDFVSNLAQVGHADVIRLDANDLEELMEEYVGLGNDLPGTFSTLGYEAFDGYVADGANPDKDGSPADSEAFVVDEENDEDDEEDVPERSSSPFGTDQTSDYRDGQMGALQKALYERRHELSKALQGIGVAGLSVVPMSSFGSGRAASTHDMAPPASQLEYVQWDDVRLTAMIDSLLNAATQKRASSNSMAEDGKTVGKSRSTVQQKRPDLPQHDKVQSEARPTEDGVDHYYQGDPKQWLSSTSGALVTALAQRLGHSKESLQRGSWRLEEQDSGNSKPLTIESPIKPRTVVHLRDAKDVGRSRLGDIIIKRLIRVVQKRRRSGEDILVIATTADSGIGAFTTRYEVDESLFRTLHVPPVFKASKDVDAAALRTILATTGMGALSSNSVTEPGYRRILEINLRHVQSMLGKLIRPDVSVIDFLDEEARRQMDGVPGTTILGDKILSIDQIQRLAITAVGLTRTQACSERVQPIHIALAAFVMKRVDDISRAWRTHQRDMQYKASRTKVPGADARRDSEGSSGRSKADKIKGDCDAHERKLLTGVVDAKNIKIGFADVHAPPETIEAMKTLTTLALLRPEAFTYGVLASDRLPGLLLYGPPGTGKTMLAKAVAKESKATVLEISGAQIYEKYVGEGEKMVRAVFSLAKKLSPCVVFIDEADAIFGSRSSAGNRNTHREIINQFLREWDGMDDHSVFMMVASNRPFDLDDAVLRRLPRRVLVDLPLSKDRESILNIHLKNEVLDSTVSTSKLAEQTPLYSGSDLKNLCVAAALACVREENELAESRRDAKEFKLPEKRTLNDTHFDEAIAEISASISEDMSSLTAIRKFDEQYGDRRGRRKKAGYGFGASDGAVDEHAARVRQPTSAPP